MKDTKVPTYKNVRWLNSSKDLHVRTSDKESRAVTMKKNGVRKQCRRYDEQGYN